MGLFGNLTTDGLEQTEDRVGGFGAIESDIYLGTIKAAYAGKSAAGAQSVSLVFDFNGKEYRETQYITNKKGENWFINKNDKTKKVPLPGFTVIDDICLVTTEKSLVEQDTEDKVVKLWDNDAKKELPTTVPMLVDLIGKKVALGIIKQTVNKNVKEGDNYVPTAETREENFIDKVFELEQSTMLTVVEARAGESEGKFHEGWLERNKGKTRDKTVKDLGKVGAPPKAGGGNASAPAAAGGTERKSLFGKK